MSYTTEHLFVAFICLVVGFVGGTITENVMLKKNMAPITVYEPIGMSSQEANEMAEELGLLECAGFLPAMSSQLVRPKMEEWLRVAMNCRYGPVVKDEPTINCSNGCR